MKDKNGKVITLGALATVTLVDGSRETGKVSHIWNDDYCEIEVEGKNSEECGVDMPFTLGGLSESITLL